MPLRLLDLAVAKMENMSNRPNLVEYNDTMRGVEVSVNHKVFFAPFEVCQGYPEDFFETIDEQGLEEIGFEFVYGKNAY